MAEPDGKVHPLLPGFTAELLPVDLPNCNNVQYRHDGKLVVLGYNGNVYLLQDTDGDGAEDHVALFWESNGKAIGQIGMDLAPKGSPHGNAVFLTVKGKIMMLADQDGDDRAEIERTLAEGWPPARAGVDVTGLALDPSDGSVWFGLGVRLYNDAYELEETGTAQNDLSGERGAIYRIAPDFSSREKICTGIRWPIALRFNRHGDLFCTDQEGATWLPNGNPFDELLHIQRGRHYGFPPRHPRHLPDVIDEPSVFDYGPQHQSTCGMNFNEPVNGGKVFGPSWWQGDALVAGESRGKIYRTKVAKTDVGYVAHNEIVACIGELAIDLCVSPKGELRLCTHSGPPDWGTGPKGKGKIWRIRYDAEQSVPQPVFAWRHTKDHVRVAFDRVLPPSFSSMTATISRGPDARAGDRFETMRPPYEVVRRQMEEGSQPLKGRGVGVFPSNGEVAIYTEDFEEQTWFSIEMSDYHLQTSASGVEAVWEEEGKLKWEGGLPHVDLAVCRELIGASVLQRRLTERSRAHSGTLKLKTQLDLWQMLHPAVQKDAQLDYEYPPETVTVTFASKSAPFVATIDGKARNSTRGHVSHDVSFTVVPQENRWISVSIEMAHEGGGKDLDLTAYWSTAEDPRQRAFATRRLIMPWAKPAAPTGRHVPSRPETAGGNWARGKEIFFGTKALCSQCHQRDGEGIHIGPDLSQLPFRDYASVLRDIREPSAAINPDYPTQEVELESGQKVVAVPVESGDGSVLLGLGPGAAMPVKKTEIKSARPVATSLMPAGLEKNLSAAELRDLMTYLLYEPPVMRDYASLPRDGVDHHPKPRTRSQLNAVLAGAPEPPEPIRPIKVTLVAGPKDHGFGEHDYPRWQHVWSRLLSMGEQVEISNAWKWPSRRQWKQADVLVFFKKGNWDGDRSRELEAFIDRGGGAVFLHWACEGGGDASTLAETIGLASNSKLTRYRHGLIDLTFDGSKPHPITRGFSATQFHDESYWNLVGDEARLTALAAGVEEGASRPLFWVRTFGEGKGRVFVSIFGHYSWTFDDPLFRALLLRGIAWTAREPVDRFNNLVDAGVDLVAP